MSRFKMQVDNQPDGSLKVKFEGAIDEDVDFSQYSLSGAKALINLSALKSINSCGIREWIKWFSQYPQMQFEFEECPKIVVDQMNMVQGFLPATGKVSSFYVPYYNDDSGDEKNVLFIFGNHFDAQGGLTYPVVKTDSGEDMEPDVVEQKYFKFLKKSA